MNMNMNANNPFDLNINNYSHSELEEVFDLPNNYDTSNIDIQETTLRQSILTNNNISQEVKTKTVEFISKIRMKLMDNIKNRNNQNGSGHNNLTSKLISSSDSNMGMSSLVKTYRDVYNLDKELISSQTISAGGTNIIQQPQTPYGMSMPSEYYKGTINPLNRRILRQNINIDTRFRDNYYNTQASNFRLDLPLRMNKVVSMQLSALELPTTFYVVSKVFGNNFFVIEINNDIDISGNNIDPLIVTIPDGNYDYIMLQNYINNFLSSRDYYKQIQFTVDINTGNVGSTGTNGSGRMLVGLTQTGIDNNLSFSLNFSTDNNGNTDTTTPLPLKMGWLMGFRMGTYTNNTNYVSESIVDLVGSKYVYLVVDEFTNNTNDSFYSAFTSSILNKNILARISLQGGVFGIFSQNNFNLVTTPRQYFGPVDIQKLHIQLLDEFGRILDLNNMDFSFCLSFQTVYDL